MDEKIEYAWPNWNVTTSVHTGNIKDIEESSRHLRRREAARCREKIKLAEHQRCVKQNNNNNFSVKSFSRLSWQKFLSCYVKDDVKSYTYT